MLLGWKKRSLEMEATEMIPREPQAEDDHQDDIVEAVLESAAQKAEEEGKEPGEEFELPLAEVTLEPGVDLQEVDFDVVLPMRARDHNLLYKAVDGESIRFQRVG